MSYSQFCKESPKKLLIHIVFGDRWSTRYSSGGSLAKEEIIEFALQKLRNRTIIPEPTVLHEGVVIPIKARRDADLAALAVCVLFDFGELHTSQRIQMELVASHMRVVWSMDRRREYVISGYPCEPILANAALHHLHEVHVRRERYHTLSVMRDAVVERHIAKGEKGELVARLILILAFYDALRLPSESPPPLKPIQSVSLKDFLAALLPDVHAGTFWSTFPCRGDRPEDTAEMVFGNAKVYFTHFVRYGMMPEAKHLWAAVVRGQAIQCSHQQEEVDIVIPIVLHPEARLAESDISFMLIQIKNRVSATTAFPIASKIGLSGRPYISILLQLGLKKQEGKQNKYTCLHTANHWVTFTVWIPARSHGMNLRRTGTESNQYCIDIRGCSDRSFRVIRKDCEDRDSEDKLFKEMLDSQDVLACHPRDHNCCVDVVAALKPSWVDRKGVFDWTDFNMSS